jgi:hypothetical protein
MQSYDTFQAVLRIRIRPFRHYYDGCGSKCKAKLHFFYSILQLSVQIIENYDTFDAAEKDNKTMLTGTAVKITKFCDFLTRVILGIGSGSGPGSGFGSA